MTDPCVIGALLNNTIITRCCHDSVLLRRRELHSCPVVRFTCPLSVWNNACECKIWRAAVPVRCDCCVSGAPQRACTPQRARQALGSRTLPLLVGLWWTRLLLTMRVKRACCPRIANASGVGPTRNCLARSTAYLQSVDQRARRVYGSGYHQGVIAPMVNTRTPNMLYAFRHPGSAELMPTQTDPAE